MSDEQHMQDVSLVGGLVVFAFLAGLGLMLLLGGLHFGAGLHGAPLVGLFLFGWSGVIAGMCAWALWRTRDAS